MDHLQKDKGCRMFATALQCYRLLSHQHSPSHLKILKSSPALLQKPQTSPTHEIPLIDYLLPAVPCIMAVLDLHGSAA
jgi:hypothetical protein